MNLTNKQKQLVDELKMISIYCTTSKCQKERMYFKNKFKEIDNKLMEEETKKYG